MWKCTFRLSALPNRWISVTAPVYALFRVNPAFCISWLSPFTANIAYASGPSL
jgi:hypothetical protein